MNIDNLLAQRKQLETAHTLASETLKGFPRLAGGLTPDVVRNTDEYKTAKAGYDAAFQALRKFNQQHAKTLWRTSRRGEGK